ncbi:RagB/SusD family nutrient uptake outer membrane protein [Mucilaginibacter sp. UR6-11]|uniref:RagB/SusD family nutrient uptake outer membrane protein n=1 Tax=Mucilaginibacter sp. UR6-11 TaxID=1435644 RepID=UPI001E43DEBC|nr:RagB/SusD family nutrient uptake outer membrane protein [Mucilaginibacter sp. UR6-11]MCC8426485.1 RagB/SusD family nutrient uptake outer membrane protein [Mucilaginibacter sp. UR6-11]
MKKIFYIAILIALTSCNKFLDVKPASQIDKTDLFQTEQGFEEALNGIYSLCSSTSLYGANLTFMNDILSQNYQFNDIVLQQTANFNYTLPSVVSKNYDTWSTAYRAIANCNYLLASVDDQKVGFNGKNRELIKGETLALRAYLHFDLLRMFAPSYLTGANQTGIPYVTRVTTKSTPNSTVKQAIDSLITDLKAAKALLKADPISSGGYIVGYPPVGNPPSNNSTELASNDLFMQNRRHRLNYYAVCGELARVYLYEGDNVNALSNALEVINAKKFPFTKQDDFFASDITKRDRIFYPELVAAWFIDTQNEINFLQDRYTSSDPKYSATVDQVADIYEIGGDGADDWRYKQWFVSTASVSGGANRAILQKYVKNGSQANLHPLVAPAIRLSEMYYIAAEASFDTNPTAALDYYNTIRAKRGIGNTLTTVPAKDAFITRLLAEARKEFYGENQLFYMYKRLNHGVVVSSTQTTPPSNNIFVFPKPQDELTYRNN